MRRISLTYLGSLALFATVASPFSSAQVANSSVNQWTLAAAMTASRSQACSAILQDGSLLVAGGTSGSGPVNSAEIYGTSGAFTLTSSMNQARVGAACATLLDGRVLVVGGDDGNGALKTAEIYDPVQQTWMPTGSLATAREGHQVMVNAWGGVWVAGGTNASGIVGTLEQYDPSPGQFVTLGTLITPRSEFAMAPLPHGRVMIAGGTNGTSAISSVEIGNQFGVVSAGGSLALARQDFAITGLPDGTFLVTGGKDVNGNLLNSTEIFDPVAGTSTAGPNLQTARAYHSAYGLTNNGAVIIAGGTGSSGALSSTETYSPWTGAIQPSAPMNSSRRNNVSAILRPGSLLVAGGLNDTGPLNSSEAFQYVTIGTDKPDYAPGTPVNISGGGWQPGEQVSVQIMALPEDLHHVEFTGSGTADGSGNVTVSGFAVDRSHLGMKFVLTATGSQFQAQTSFTDAINPTIGYVFSPASGSISAAGGPVQVTVTFSGTNGPPLGLFEACLNGTCGPANISNPGPCSATSGVFTLPGGGPDSCVFTIVNIPAGTTQVGVFYVDTIDSNYNQVQPPGTNTAYTVLSPTTTSMTGGPSGGSVPYGDTAPYTASVTTQNGNAATGQVQFLVGGLTTYNGGANTIPLVTLTGSQPNYTASWVPNPPFAVGSTDVVTAQFLGDAVNVASTSGNNVSSVIVAATTTTPENFSANPIVYGQPLTISGTVTATGGGIPPGTVSVTGTNGFIGCGAQTLSITGTYSCTVTAPGPGVAGYSVTATYTPSNAGYSGSASGATSLTVNQASTTVSAPVVTASSGTSFTFQAQATAVAPSTAPVNAGTITFYSLPGSNNLSSCSGTGTLLTANATVNSTTGVASSGSVTLPGTGGSPINYTICAVYTPSANFVGSTSLGMNITSPAAGVGDMVSTPTGGPAVFGSPVTISAIVSATGGGNAPLPGTLTFNDTSNAGAQVGTIQNLVMIGNPSSDQAAASVTVSNLTVGAHTITATYNSTSGAFVSPTTSAAGTINITTTAAPFTVSSGAPNTILSGSNVANGTPATFIATYTGGVTPPPAGNITFTNGVNTVCGPVALSTTLGVTTATCNATAGSTGLPLGAASVTLTFADTDGNYTQGVITPFNFTVVKATTNTALTFSANPAVVGIMETLTATVTVPGTPGINPTGTVTFTLGGTTPPVGTNTCLNPVAVVNNAGVFTASCQFELVGPIGQISYGATYNGDTHTLASTANLLSLTVTGGATTTTLTANGGTLETVGQTVILTATVSSAVVGSLPSGTFTFTLGGNASNGTSTCGAPVAINQATGVATCQFQFAGAGTSTATYIATYSGNNNFLTSNATLTLNTVKASTTTTVSEVNNATVIQVTPVAPAIGAPTGTVTVSNGTSTVAGGTLFTSTACTAPAAAICSILSTSLGSGAFSASYSGDQNFQASSSASTSVTHTNPATTLSLTSSSYTVSAGTPVSLTAFVSGSGAASSPSGAVTFTDNGTALPGGTVLVTGGSATLNNVILLFSGNNTIVATYSGDSTYPGSTAIIGVSVGVLPSIVTFSASSGTAVYGQTITLSVHVANGTQGGATPTGTVQFYDNTGSGTVAIGSPVPLSASGSATLPVSNLPPGTNTIYAVFTAVGNFGGGQSPLSAGAIVVSKGTTILPTLTVTDNNGQETVTASITVAAPGGGTPTGTVTFTDTVTGKVLGTPQTLAGGTASITIPVTLDPISATYSGDSNFFTGSTTTKVSAIAAVNAASFNDSYPITFAADEIVTVFGTALATQNATATTLPLPTTLGGVSVSVTDSTGTTRSASMFSVYSGSPSQVSFLIPAGTANGTATVTVTTASGSSTETINVTGSSPGLFVANDNGAGPLSAQVETVTPSGTQTFTNTAVVSGETFVNAPFVLTPAADSFYLILYGTGFDSGTVSSVVVTINGKTYTPAFVGPQGGFVGLDQINVLLPASLAGSGTVNVSISVNGTVSNTGTVAFH